MADAVSLKDLIEALAGSVISAQDRIEQHQIAKLAQYFDAKSNRPISVNIKLPDLSVGADEEDEVDISIPLLALVGCSTLSIKAMDVEFDVDLSDVGDPEDVQHPPSAQEGENQTWHNLKPSKSIGVDWRAAGSKKMARLSLKVEAQEPTEGMARLIQRLNKLI
ncbi:DUF2589 domain-containing protein [Methylomonas rhizoryzae]|uniref:DUF2589 domain-containing protein n=1 Tax=Methylomonas rhizoryzae TaxID=2608981 RepID=UPI001231CFD9|nr:DUF2589 domain-containing protein [Methylomonas rhizoryzae]